jgi:hypothetical protein
MAGGSAPAGLSDVGITSSSIDDMAPEGNDGAEGAEGANTEVSDNEIKGFGNQ